MTTLASPGLTDLPQPPNITVPRGGMICLNNVHGKTLRVMSGSVWITQEDDNGDTSLNAGESFCITRSGLVVVNACQYAPVTSVMLEAPAPIRHKLMESLRRLAFSARRGLRRGLAVSSGATDSAGRPA